MSFSEYAIAAGHVPDADAHRATIPTIRALDAAALSR